MNNNIYKKCMIVAFRLLILGFISYAIHGLITFDPFKIVISLGCIWIFYRAIKHLNKDKNGN